MSAPFSPLSGRALAVGDTVRIRGLDRSHVDSRHATWLIGRIGRVSALLATGGHVEITIDVTGLPTAAGRRTKWTLHALDLELVAPAAITPRTEPRPGDRVRVQQLLLSHSDICAHDQLIGCTGVIMALGRNGSHVLVLMDEEVRIAGVGLVHRLVFHRADLAITMVDPAPAPAPKYGTALTGDGVRHAAAVPAAPGRGQVSTACGVRAAAVLIGDWSPPFVAGLERACRACLGALSEQGPPPLPSPSPRDLRPVDTAFGHLPVRGITCRVD
ncbi:hypothetical protein HS048_33915 [Planomonospora sp. ID91781]|uniref:hypothetical protein n=1 Tax=Planomonospora sp. ID91781 TaxID=2738135 RepID=UPI0018C3B6E9|nr:hypothetical protein [Planomonospora sp. ID91781]MBG0825684.1 hypothetical protein [Planomonospora sp. ID91781]